MDPHPAPGPFPLLWGSDDLGAAARAGTPWLWQGYLARGALTLLTGQWKSGKTTLASILLARMKTGGQLAGLPLAPGKAVVVTEESPDHWLRRHHQQNLGDHVGWFCRPFHGKPRLAQWLALLDQLAELHARRDLSLVVIDPLAAFLPGRSENDAACMLEALTPLQRLTSAGLSVLGQHHPRKGKSAPGQAARGSSVLSAHADILIEMRWFRRTADNDRRRQLLAFSRFPDTPRRLLIELNAEGTDYFNLGSSPEQDPIPAWQTLQFILKDAPKKLTRHDIRNAWPDTGRLPGDMTLFRWLERANTRGLLRRDGDGTRTRPFRYWLPESEDRWRKDPLACLYMPELLTPPWP